MAINSLGMNYYYGSYGNYGNGLSTSNTNMFSDIYSDNMFTYNGLSADGCDDGKISFGSKVKNFFKGVGNTIVGAIKSLATPKGLLKAAACIALCVVTGGAAAPVLAGIGIAKGALTVAKGASAASKATTDEEAELAWQTMGSGTFQVAASAVAMKGAVGAMKVAGNGSFSAGMKSSFEGSIAGKALANSSAGQAFSYTKMAGGTTSEALQAAKIAAKDSARNLGSKALDAIKDPAARSAAWQTVKSKGLEYSASAKSYAAGAIDEISATIEQVGLKSAVKIYGQEAVSKAVEYGKLGYGKYLEAAEASGMSAGQFGTLILANQI